MGKNVMDKSIEEMIIDIFKDDPEVQRKLKEKLLLAIDSVKVESLTGVIEGIMRNVIDDDETIYDAFAALARKIVKEHITDVIKKSSNKK